MCNNVYLHNKCVILYNACFTALGIRGINWSGDRESIKLYCFPLISSNVVGMFHQSSSERGWYRELHLGLWESVFSGGFNHTQIQTDSVFITSCCGLIQNRKYTHLDMMKLKHTHTETHTYTHSQLITVWPTNVRNGRNGSTPGTNGSQRCLGRGRQAGRGGGKVPRGEGAHILL